MQTENKKEEETSNKSSNDNKKREKKDNKSNKNLLDDGIENIKDIFNEKNISNIKNIANKKVEKIKSIKDNKKFVQAKEKLVQNIKNSTISKKIKEGVKKDKDRKTRVITALALSASIAIMLFFDSFFIIWLALGVISYIAIKESATLYKIKENSTSLYVTAGVIWAIALFYPKPTDLLIIAIVLFVSIKAFMTYTPLKEFYPILYPFAPMVFLLTLYINSGSFALLWLIVTVAVCDIGAYYIGKIVGKNQFCQTSPNKTVEGVVGGVVVATIVGTIVGVFSYSISLAFTVSLFVSIASIFGDLFESYLKRAADVKDSGSILPGHGGVLDRIDGHLFGGIIMVIMLSSFA